MTKANKVLFITQEITPYVSESEMANIGRNLPQAIQEKGREIRTFMPKWGNINERRNQLHEVIRLSGMNLIIDDTDHPLIIKVASIQSARMQVYFIDNDDYFQNRMQTTDENGIEYDDNDSRAVFYARGVLETVKKLRWCPDVIHCHGWMTALAPLYIKKAYKDEPSFRDAKVVFSVYEDDFKSTLSDDFAAKLMLKGISKKDLGDLKEPVDYAALCKLAVDYSDGVIQNSEKVDESIIEYARQSGKLVLDYQNPENYADACNEFYDQVWDATANEEEYKNQDTTIMKANYALIVLLAITFWGCDDNTAGLGLRMFPESDRDINGKLSTFDVITESVHAGKIYAMTNVGYVGKFTDETFGTYQAGFLAQLNCPEGMTFPGVYNKTALDSKGKATQIMVGDDNEDNKDVTFIRDDENKIIGNIHTIELYLWYSSYFGDSLTACRLSVYDLGEAEKELNQENAYYTDIEPEEFYNPENLLGTKAYTAVDLSVKDSIRKLSTYVPSVHVSFKQDAAIEIGTKIIQEANKFGVNFDNKTFRKIFKGIYVKSDYGDGTVLYINQAQMNVVYKCYAVDTLTGIKLKKKVAEEDGKYKDSTYYGYRTFATTREVIQANQLKNETQTIDNLINLEENWDKTYLKTPAGIFTQATLPIDSIANVLAGDTLNAVKLTFTNYNQPADKKFGMSIPSNVMLIRKKEKDSFFKENKLTDGISSYLTSHSSNINQYSFNNITQLINACIVDKEEARKKAGSSWDEKAWENNNPDWNKVVLIPVLVTYDSSSSNSYYGTSSNIISIQHDLKPGYVRLKGGKLGENLVLKKDKDGNIMYNEKGEPIYEYDQKYVLKLEVVSTQFKSTK